jgi:hypothetical protein
MLAVEASESRMDAIGTRTLVEVERDNIFRLVVSKGCFLNNNNV